MVNLTIDNRKVQVEDGTTILQAAESIGIYIPQLCYWKDLNEVGACRMCVVEVKGNDRLPTACDTLVHEGMEVYTDSSRVVSARKINLRLIMSQHNLDCKNCIRTQNCVLQDLFIKLKVNARPYTIKLERNRVDLASPLSREADKCVKCLRCVQVCDKIQRMHVWDVLGIGSRVTVGTTGNVLLSQSNCTYCGQCVTHCPVGALTARDDTIHVQEVLGNSNITVIALIDPTVADAWAELLERRENSISLKCLVASLHRIGFKYVFNSSVGYDLAAIEVSNELVGRLSTPMDYRKPIFSSVCSGSAKFLKSQFPEFTPGFLTAKSPQQMLGSVVRNYFVPRHSLNPQNVCIVSIGPCMVKKIFSGKEIFTSVYGVSDVDYFLTTRELYRLFKVLKFQLNDSLEDDFDSPFVLGSRLAFECPLDEGFTRAVLCSINNCCDRDIVPITVVHNCIGGQQWKEVTVRFSKLKEVRVAIASGLGNARALLEDIQTEKVGYDFVDIRACPGGCISGGGQPIHNGVDFKARRITQVNHLASLSSVLFPLDSNSVEEIYDQWLGKPMSEKAIEFLHTDHLSWSVMDTRDKD